jgi:Flp pilus assembly protein TadG
MNTARAHKASPDASATERARSQKGNALVEFALVLPVFLLLVFGTITYSIALYDKTILTMASREIARAGAVYDGSTTPSVWWTDTAIKNRADAAAITKKAAWESSLVNFAGPMSIAFTYNASPSTDHILKVTAKATYIGIFFLVSPGIEISATTSMGLEE